MVGASCVNAVSSYYQVVVNKNGKIYRTRFEKGIVTEPTHEIGTVAEGVHGTETSFVLDDSIWKDDILDLKRIDHRCRQLAYLNPGLKIMVYFDTKDAAGNDVKEEKTYCFPEGIKAYVEMLTKGKTQLIPPELITAHVMSEEKNDIELAVGFCYTDTYSSDIKGFVNNIYQEYGGDHVTGLKEGFAKAMSRYAVEEGFLKSSNDIKQADALEGLVAVLSVAVPDPNYEGQGKNNLRMKDVRTVCRESISDFFFDYLSRDVNRAKVLVEKAISAAKARAAAKKARDAARGITKAAASGSLPEKFSDCSGNDPEKDEIFLVEGDSAAGSAKQGRDRHFQAILPVFGKILNAEKSTPDKVYSSMKTLDVIKALRCGIGEDFDINKLRYHKIIIMSDADVDGFHIQCLHMTFFYRYMPELIKKGYLYAACPPLFKVTKGKGKNAEVTYLYSNAELAAFDTEGCSVQRYKGLGEMDATQLWDTTMDPAKRRLNRITIKDAEEAENMLAVCMGKDVEARKEFIVAEGSALALSE